MNKNSNQRTLLHFTTWVDISRKLTVLLFIGVLVGLIIGLIRGSWIEAIVFSASIPPILAFFGLLAVFMMNMISGLFFTKNRNTERHDQKDVADPIT